MDTDRWRDLAERAEAHVGERLRTPESGRTFGIEAVSEDRIEVRYDASGLEGTLRREGFSAIADRLADRGELSLSGLPAHVEPYVSVLSLSPEYAVDPEEGVLRVASSRTGETPFLLPPRPDDAERLEGDALVLADLLDRTDAARLGSLSTESLVDRYVVLSDVERGADDLRRAVGDVLLERLGTDGRLHGRFGSVTRTGRRRRHLKDEDEVLAALDAHDVPHEWVLGVVPEKLDVVLAVTDLEADAVYDVEEQVYVQKTGTDPDAKRARLAGLRDRLDRLDTEEAAALRTEIEHLESRLDDLLAAG